MSTLIYQIFTSSTLITYSLFHLISTIRHYHKSPRDYTAKPYHPISLAAATTSTTTTTSRLRHLPLYLAISALSASILHHSLSSFDSDPLLKGHSPVHFFTSLQSATVSLLFLLLSLLILLSDTTSIFSLLPNDVIFATASVTFFLHYTVLSSRASVQTSDLQARCDAVSGRISAVSGSICAVLAFLPRVFAADVALAGSICLQGLWALQTGLSLYVEAFIPEGCHRLLDVVSGVEGSTKCDLDESKLRAVAILDLAFLVHLIVVVVLVFVVYAIVSKTAGVSTRRFGSYEALPNAVDNNHVQLKTLSGTQA